MPEPTGSLRLELFGGSSEPSPVEVEKKARTPKRKSL